MAYKKRKVIFNDIDIFSFTVCPNDEVQSYDFKPRFSTWLEKSRKFLLDNLKYARYTLYPEISTPCNSAEEGNPRWHFHGTIQFDNHTLFMSEEWHELKKYCIFEIDTKDSTSKWCEYCFKNRKFVEPLFGADYILTNLNTECGPITARIARDAAELKAREAHISDRDLSRTKQVFSFSEDKADHSRGYCINKIQKPVPYTKLEFINELDFE